MCSQGHLLPRRLRCTVSHCTHCHAIFQVQGSAAARQHPRDARAARLTDESASRSSSPKPPRYGVCSSALSFPITSTAARLAQGAWTKFHGRPLLGSGRAVLRTRTYKSSSLSCQGEYGGTMRSLSRYQPCIRTVQTLYRRHTSTGCHQGYGTSRPLIISSSSMCSVAM